MVVSIPGDAVVSEGAVPVAAPVFGVPGGEDVTVATGVAGDMGVDVQPEENARRRISPASTHAKYLYPITITIYKII